MSVSHCKGAADIFLQNPGCKVHCCSQWRSIPTIKYKPFYMYAPSILNTNLHIYVKYQNDNEFFTLLC